MKPTAFEFSEYAIGLLGGFTRISLCGDKLKVSHASEPLETPAVHEVAVSPSDWAEFVEVLDAINAWGWQKEYRPTETIYDGAGWALKITVNGRKIDSKGENAYPGDADQFIRGFPIHWPQYEALRAAVMQLIKSNDL